MLLKVDDQGNFIKAEKLSNLELKQLQLSLTKKIKNARFSPLVKRGIWDGVISFLDRTNRFPTGLWYYVKNICDVYGFDFSLEGIERIVDMEFDKEDFEVFVADFFKDSKKKPRDYQIHAAAEILKWRHCVSEIATSAGKTLIIFMVWAYLKHKGISQKFLLIVPNISLVTQGLEDFEEYSKDRSLIKYKIQALGGGRETEKRDVDIVIGTYQTLTKLDAEFYQDVNVVCVDECHATATKSVKDVLSKCKQAQYRFGLSGTARVSDDDADSLTITSLLGPMVNKISANYLFGRKFATPIYIRMLILDYLEEEIRESLIKLRAKKVEFDGSKMLQLERQLVIESDKRFEFVVNTISKVKKNSLILFHNIKDQYGVKIFNRLKEQLDNNYEIYYVDGSTKDVERQRYIDKMDDKSGTIKLLVASFGTFSTGISINDLHYIFLTESFKSDRLIKQSLGRGMRLDQNKNIVNIIDFVDDFSLNGHQNYLMKHAYEREEMYIEEKYQYKKLKVRL